MNTRISDAGLKHLKGLAKLASLYLNGTQVTDMDLQHLNGMTKLRLLGLDQTQVSDTGLEHLKGLTTLARIYLQKTKVTPQGVADFQRALPKCDITWDDPSKSDRTAAEWVLGIRGTIETETDRFIGDVRLPKEPIQIVKIYLAGNPQVTDDNLNHLNGLTNLKELSLARTNITDAGLEQLKGLTNLTILHTSSTFESVTQA